MLNKQRKLQQKQSTIFKISHQSRNSRARLGTLVTNHGLIQTPAFVPVATKGTIKSLPPIAIASIPLQAVFVNIYHIALHPGIETVRKAGGIHQYAQLALPIFTDSGGFQIFSLAQRTKAKVSAETESLVLKISPDGVVFRSTYDGTVIEFTPESSIEYQFTIGSNCLMALDECTYYPATYTYTKKSLIRTHEWEMRSLRHFQKLCSKHNSQAILYGIIQGGMYQDLREQSARYIREREFPAIAIGGVSVGEPKSLIYQQVNWTTRILASDPRPRHLLGVGQIEDIVALVKCGIDTFDCVEPTRLARMGKLFTSLYLNKQTTKYRIIDITKGSYKRSLFPVDRECPCYTCTNFTRSYLHHLFKQRELLGYSLATYHNLYFMEQLMKKIREFIASDML